MSESLPRLFQQPRSATRHTWLYGSQDDSGWEMFDGVKFDPKGDLEAYAKGFTVNNAKG